jgi:hypothetical protein
MVLQHFEVLTPDYHFHTLALPAEAAEAGQ